MAINPEPLLELIKFFEEQDTELAKDGAWFSATEKEHIRQQARQMLLEQLREWNLIPSDELLYGMALAAYMIHTQTHNRVYQMIPGDLVLVGLEHSLMMLLSALREERVG